MTPRVLVLDPDPDSCLVFIAALSSLGCTSVDEAGLGVGPGLRVSTGPIDVVLLGSGGVRADMVALVMRLREADPYLGVVAVSDTPAAPSGLDEHLGASEWIVDPVDALAVASAVVRVARLRHEEIQALRYVEGLKESVRERSAQLTAALQHLTVCDAADVRRLLEALAPGIPELFTHASRVAAHAVALATEWGLPVRDVQQIEMAALLHDVGKLAVPDLLLERPGPLTDEEISVVRTHPRIGAHIVRRIGLEHVADIVLGAHERFDGRGYPDGLAGYAIPIGARIVAIADVFDALTSSRVYRDPVSRAAAAAEIAQAAGSQFDPDLVRAWLRTMDARLPRTA